MTDTTDTTDSIHNEASLDRRARGRARANLDRWGKQPMPLLTLALAEELGETAGEVIPDTSPDPRQTLEGTSWYYLKRTETAGESIRKFLEESFEEAGEPLPPDERPSVVEARDDLDEEAVREELVDLMALCYQAWWSL